MLIGDEMTELDKLISELANMPENKYHELRSSYVDIVGSILTIEMVVGAFMWDRRNVAIMYLLDFIEAKDIRIAELEKAVLLKTDV